MCLADFEFNYVSKKIGDVPIEPHDIKSYTIPVPKNDDIEPNPNIIVLKNEPHGLWKHSRPCIICFYKVSILKVILKAFTVIYVLRGIKTRQPES